MNLVIKSVDNSVSARYGLVAYERPVLALGERLPVRIDPDDLKGVAFVCEDRKADSGATERTPVGTAFFVGFRSEAVADVEHHYIVTARHILGMSDRDNFYIRITKAGGKGITDIPTARRQWKLHETVDVAATPLVPDGLDCLTIPLDLFVGPGPDYRFPPVEVAIFPQVAIGDEVFAIGLFTQHHSDGTGMLPIARFGRVSQMPSPVSIDIERGVGGHIDRLSIIAYLVEFLSWGGMSGSPVFWFPPPHTLLSPLVAKQPEHQRVFLGLVSAHFHIRQPTDQSELSAEKTTVKLNSGIAIVTPCEAVRELLMCPFFVEDRRRREAKIIAERSSRTTSDGTNGIDLSTTDP